MRCLPPALSAMLRETLVALHHLGPLRVAGLLLGVMAVGVLWRDAGGNALRPVLTGGANLVIGHLVSRAVLLKQPLLCRADGLGALRQIGPYLLASLWVYAVAMLCACVALYTVMMVITQTGLIVMQGIEPFIWGAGLVLLGTLAIFGTALPAAAIGAPYGPQAAREATRGMRCALFGALLLGPGLLHLLKLWGVLPRLRDQGDKTALWPVRVLELGPVQGGLIAVMTTLGVVLTATLLAVAWRRHRSLNLAEVFQ